MSEVIRFEGKKARTKLDAIDDLDTQLNDLEIVADLIAAAEDSRIDVDGLNGAGYLLGRMINVAQELSKEVNQVGGAK